MAAAAATAAAAADPPGYFVGRPLQYQEPQQQTVPQLPPAEAAPAPAPAVDDQNAVNAQVPGYYKRRVQPRPTDGSEHNNNNNNNKKIDAAAQQNHLEPGCLAKLFACFSGSS